MLVNQQPFSSSFPCCSLFLFFLLSRLLLHIHPPILPHLRILFSLFFSLFFSLYRRFFSLLRRSLLRLYRFLLSLLLSQQQCLLHRLLLNFPAAHFSVTCNSSLKLSLMLVIIFQAQLSNLACHPLPTSSYKSFANILSEW